jgi:hypothetical protein
MKIEITLDKYMFPFMLALFKALHMGKSVQWWRAMSKRHFSYAHVAKRPIADATIYIDLYWLVGLWKEPKFTIKHYIIRPVVYIFAIPYILAYLSMYPYILHIYIRFMDMLNDGISAGENWFLFGMSYPDIVAIFTPRGLWEGYCAYAYDDLEQAIINSKSIDNVLAEMAAKGLCTVEPGGTEPTLLKSQPMTEAEKDLCQAINDGGPAVSLDLVLTDMCLPYYDSPAMSPLEKALCDEINDYFKFVPL